MPISPESARASPLGGLLLGLTHNGHTNLPLPLKPENQRALVMMSVLGMRGFCQIGDMLNRDEQCKRRDILTGVSMSEWVFV